MGAQNWCAVKSGYPAVAMRHSRRVELKPNLWRMKSGHKENFHALAVTSSRAAFARFGPI
jgi:hypothetical protein